MPRLMLQLLIRSRAEEPTRVGPLTRTKLLTTKVIAKGKEIVLLLLTRYIRRIMLSSAKKTCFSN